MRQHRRVADARAGNELSNFTARKMIEEFWPGAFRPKRRGVVGNEAQKQNFEAWPSL